MKYCCYPVGHPIILTENIDLAREYFGLMKCKILPPRGLHAPVLPKTFNGKNVYTLCNTCAQTYQKTPCKHTDEERCLEGTWCTPEIYTAVRYGYKILHVYELWHWEETEIYDPVSKKGGLFTEYINASLKDKQEASGFPAGCETQEQKLQYQKDYYDNEGTIFIFILN